MHHTHQTRHQQYGWEAHCTCGWSSEYYYKTEQEAADEAAEHKQSEALAEAQQVKLPLEDKINGN